MGSIFQPWETGYYIRAPREQNAITKFRLSHRKISLSVFSLCAKWVKSCPNSLNIGNTWKIFFDPVFLSWIGFNERKKPSHATVPLRNHFHRMTVSLGDHNVNNTHSETKNVFRKLKRIVRSDSSTEFRSHNNGQCWNFRTIYGG